MARKPKSKPARPGLAKDLWVNPRSNMRGPDENRDRDRQGNSSRGRFLELADVALRLKKPSLKKRTVAAIVEQSSRKAG
jgi:hypothetical protein